jgi:hypothetical protein
MTKTAMDSNKAFASSKEPGAVRFKEGLQLPRRQRNSLDRAAKTVVVNEPREGNREILTNLQTRLVVSKAQDLWA